MELETVYIYCLCDEILKKFQIKDHPQSRMTNAEILSFIAISSIYHNCDYKKTRLVALSLKHYRFILSHSRIIRRIHAIPKEILHLLFLVLRETIRDGNCMKYIVDSFPVITCQNNKTYRCRLVSGKEYLGYTASKKSYFFGVKVHMITDVNGVPIEFLITPGSESDIAAFRGFMFDLPEKSVIFADRAYTDYQFEDDLREFSGINLIAKRKGNAKRQHSAKDAEALRKNRNRIETCFSSIVNLMPRSIRAKTIKGFCLKVFFFVLGYTFKKAFARL